MKIISKLKASKTLRFDEKHFSVALEKQAGFFSMWARKNTLKKRKESILIFIALYLEADDKTESDFWGKILTITQVLIKSGS